MEYKFRVQSAISPNDTMDHKKGNLDLFQSTRVQVLRLWGASSYGHSPPVCIEFVATSKNRIKYQKKKRETKFSNYGPEVPFSHH